MSTVRFIRHAGLRVLARDGLVALLVGDFVGDAEAFGEVYDLGTFDHAHVAKLDAILQGRVQGLPLGTFQGHTITATVASDEHWSLYFWDEGPDAPGWSTSLGVVVENPDARSVAWSRLDGHDCDVWRLRLGTAH